MDRGRHRLVQANLPGEPVITRHAPTVITAFSVQETAP